jgi:hypothetical protein
MGFYNVEEFNIRGRFVAGVYVGLLDRDAEYGGWLFQRNALAASGDQQGLVGAFLAGAEYALRFGAPSNQEFVRLLYRHILLREASQPEVDFQVANLASRPAMAKNFLNSTEFRIGTGPRLTAFLVYATLLQRDPSLAEFDSRANELATSQKSVQQIVTELISTPEFSANLN